MRWNFHAVPYGEYKGLNDSGIEWFSGNTVAGLAREVCQNSLDACDDSTIPVMVELKKFSITANEFLGKERLIQELEGCGELANSMKSSETRAWIKRAHKILSSETVEVLRISDFNTTGLLGANLNNPTTPWHSLVRSSGLSDKNSTDGGSFGIGKFASFACSLLRTVFFSTYSNDGNKAYQGIARLPSSELKENHVTTGFGYYGLPDGRPIPEEIGFDKFYKRAENQFGTDIYIMGFSANLDDPNEWSSRIIGAVLDGFLFAIYENKLAVKIGDLCIDQSNLGTLVEEYSEYGTGRSLEYYEVLTSDDTYWITVEDFMKSKLGEVKLGILLKDGFHRKVAGIRSTGMMIQEIDRINSRMEFAGLLLLKGTGINHIMRSMENPKHNQWNPNKLTENRPFGRLCYSTLRNLINETLSGLAEGDAQDEFDSNIGDLLPDLPTDNSGPEVETETIDDRIKTITASRKVSLPPRCPAPSQQNPSMDIPDKSGEKEEENEVSGTGQGDGKGGSGVGYGQEEGDGRGRNEEVIKKSPYGAIHITQERIICSDKKNGKYILFFTPRVSAIDVKLALYIVSETREASIPAPLRDCFVAGQNVVISGNKIENMELRKDSPIKIRFSIAYEELCSMEFKVYGNWS